VLRGFGCRARAVHRDVDASLRQRKSNCRTQAARRARDQSGSAFEIEFVFFVGQGSRVLSE